MDQGKKTMRHFYCRDVLWETFEQMANDFDCSIDYLVNEAMRYYARSKNYQGSAGYAGAQGSFPSEPAIQREPSRGAGLSRRPPPPPTGAEFAPSRRVSSAGPAVAPRRSAPRSMPAEPALSAGPTLFLVFNNQRISIDKDQFIIGRGSKTSDLAIKDGNISRKHAAVIRRNGTYYIKDLGSTNGIDYKGMRIDNKRIDEGDVFHLCDYELRFTYR
jgi:hypothetical protein